jgi:hypothetical protein
MAAYNISIPEPLPDDARQEQRDAQLERIRQSLDWGAIRIAVLERVALDMLTHDGPIGTVVDQLEDAPISSRWDLDAWLRWCGPRDSAKIGKALMQIIGEACLKAVQEADDVGF